MAKVETKSEVIIYNIEVTEEELAMLTAAMGKQAFGYELFKELDNFMETKGIKRYDINF